MENGELRYLNNLEFNGRYWKATSSSQLIPINIKKIFLLIVSFLILISCNKDETNIEITNFSDKKVVILEPYRWKPYSMLKIKVKGYTNDTIRINYNLYGDTNFYLSGKFDTLLVQTDYYGEGPVTLIVDPYKATEGKLKLDFNL